MNRIIHLWIGSTYWQSVQYDERPYIKIPFSFPIEVLRARDMEMPMTSSVGVLIFEETDENRFYLTV